MDLLSRILLIGLILMSPRALFLSGEVDAQVSSVRVKILTKYHPQTLTVLIQGGDASILTPSGTKWNLSPDQSVTIFQKDSNLAITFDGATYFTDVELHLIPQHNRVLFLCQLPEGVARGYYGKLIFRKGETELEIINSVHEWDYLTSVVQSEMGTAPLEALKAQAVVSRTFLYKHRKSRDSMKRDFDFTDLTEYQSYGGNWGETRLARRSVMETNGEVIVYKGQLITPLFHSTSGDYTLDAFDVWGRERIPYLIMVREQEGSVNYNQMSPHFHWQRNISRIELHRILAKTYALKNPEEILEVRKVDLVREDLEAYPGKIEVVGPGIKIGTDQFRLDVNRVLGWNTIKSNWFKMELIDRNYHFTGKGLGHGVGMSQWGAQGMAHKGYNYQRILRHYYPGCVIKGPNP